MARRSIALIALTLTAGVSLASAGSGDAVAIARVTPRVAFGPVDVMALVQVEPHAENRRLQLILDSGEYYFSTDIQLDGAGARKSHFVTWRAVRPGKYLLTATVYRASGRVNHCRRELRIYGPDESVAFDKDVRDPAISGDPR
ncbi:MAG: hypothetical protein ACRD1S_13270 [Vicinamibacterales bacterium]